MLQKAEVVVVGTRGIDRSRLESHLRPEQVVVDLVPEKARPPTASSKAYEGLCW